MPGGMLMVDKFLRWVIVAASENTPAKRGISDLDMSVSAVLFIPQERSFPKMVFLAPMSL